MEAGSVGYLVDRAINGTFVDGAVLVLGSYSRRIKLVLWGGYPSGYLGAQLNNH